MSSAPSIASISSALVSNSFERNACVMPCMLSSTATAMS